MSSPRRSKRKCKSDYASPSGRARIEANDTLKVLKAIGPSSILTNASDSSNLLQLCFGRMNPHIWYRILPLDAMKCDDVAFGTGQSWDLLRPLLLNLEYLYEYGGGFRVNINKFANLQHVEFGKNRFHLSNTQLNGESKNYFVCIGKPHFSGPTQQLKAIANGAFASTCIRYINASDTILRSKLQNHIDIIINDKYRTIIRRDNDRITTLETTQIVSVPSEASIPPQAPLSTKLSDAIDGALALDLRIYPRPNRNDPTKSISLNKTRIRAQGGPYTRPALF